MRALRTAAWALAALVWLGAGTGVAREPPPAVVGLWLGTLHAGTPLRLVAHIGLDGQGILRATVDSIDQGAKGIPVASVKLAGSDLTLELPAIHAQYVATLDATGNALVGKWTQNGVGFPLTLARTDKAPEPVQPDRPQQPKRPFPYDETEVTVDHAAAKVKLAGTLTTPRTPGPHPAVLLITGSGAQDRDESLMGHKPFLVISDALTRRGIAVLRVDDRGYAKSTGDVKSGTTADFAADALACVAFLKRRPEIDPKRIGLVGHSEGGVIAAMVAAQSRDVAFVVLLAGTGLPGEQILYLQHALIARAGGRDQQQLEKDRQEEEKLYTILKREQDVAVAEKQLRALYDAQSEAERAKPENSKARFEQMLPMVLSPWFRYFLTLDPRPYLRKIKVPLLALNGERDLQVPTKQNLAAIREALAIAKNPDVTTRELPGLNHLFQTCRTGAPSEYARIPETFAPSALELLGDWLVSHAHLAAAAPAKPR